MATFFIFGSLWFWLLSVIAVVFVMYHVENDDEGSSVIATVGLIAFLLLCYFMGNDASFKNFFMYAKENPGIVLSGIILYFVLGTVWSFVKWYIYIKKEKARKGSSFDVNHYKLGDYDNSSKILSWMSYWPLSLIWNFIDQPIKRTFKWIMLSMEKRYDAIVKNIANEK
jgi:hypothetical protein